MGIHFNALDESWTSVDDPAATLEAQIDAADAIEWRATLLRALQATSASGLDVTIPEAWLKYKPAQPSEGTSVLGFMAVCAAFTAIVATTVYVSVSHTDALMDGWQRLVEFYRLFAG